MSADWRDSRHISSARSFRRRLASVRVRAAVAGIAVVVVLGAASCSSSGSGSGSATQSAAGSGSPHRGGSVTELALEDVTMIDPAFDTIAITNSYEMPTLEAVYGPGLVYLDPKTGAVEMGFAESLTTNDSGRVWTLVLHPGLKFSDGTPFNAAAVAFNIARDADPATGSPLQSTAAQLATKVLSSTVLQITCTPADAQFPTILSQDFAMVASPTAVQKEGKNFGTHPVGPGPFKVQSSVYGISWSFVRNSYYSLFAPGQPYLNSIKVAATSSTQQTLTALQSGAAQTFITSDGTEGAQARAIGFTVVADPQPGLTYLTFNTSKPPFNDLTAREAVYDAISAAGVADVWSPGDPVVTNLFTPNSPFFSAKYNFPSQNTAEAQKLFNQLAAEGKPLQFSVLWPAIGSIGNLPSYLIGAFAQFKNVKVTSDAVPQTQYTQDTVTSNFDVGEEAIGTPVPGVAQTFQTKGSSNFSKFSDPTLDAALAQLQDTTDQATEKQLWDTIQQELIDQYPGVPIYRPEQGFVYNASNLGGISLTQSGLQAFWGPMYLK
jgi:ABC-type transport system substrate-binding protein